MSDPADPGSWAEKADEDYQLVLLSLRRKKPLTYGATFHAQQCAEKYLKGLLVRQGVSPPKVHDLVLRQIISARCIVVATSVAGRHSTTEVATTVKTFLVEY
jgi:HEPN domain-containing protein